MTNQHQAPYTDPLLLLFCNRLGIQLSEDPKAMLTRVLQAFAMIPYENLTKIICVNESHSTVAKQSPEDVIQGFFTHGSGGTCFPLTLTLQRLIRGLGFEVYPILADRRYGQDTHCALICRLSHGEWHLIDPGYLITTPCPIPSVSIARYELPLTTIELRPLAQTLQVALHTGLGARLTDENLKYRLTYKVNPVDEIAFNTAWDRSFDWEMMTYPIISTQSGNRHIYLQKNNLFVRSNQASSKITLSSEQLITEVSNITSLSPEIIKRALGYLS